MFAMQKSRICLQKITNLKHRCLDIIQNTYFKDKIKAKETLINCRYLLIFVYCYVKASLFQNLLPRRTRSRDAIRTNTNKFLTNLVGDSTTVRYIVFVDSEVIQR